MQPDGKSPDPKLAIAQAAVALVLLIGLPIAVGTPATPMDIAVAAIAGMILLAFLVEGVARFMRSRRRPFLDSVLPPEARGGASKKDKADDL